MDFPSLRRLQSLLRRFPSQRILVLGDLMLDHFIRGRVRRISPEAPVPVVAVDQESHAPGGAGNVCSNLSALGARVRVFSTVGDDLAGTHLLRDLEDRGVDTSGVVRDPSRVTTQKCRIVAEHQQVVRFDRETCAALPAATIREILGRLKRAMADAKALVISDYGKGIVSPGAVREAVRAARRAGLPVIVDPKVENFRRYKGVDCITPNVAEAFGGMGRPVSHEEETLRALGARILKTLQARSVLVTRSEKGMTLFERGRPPRHFPTQAQEVFDVTGAGDTVVSVVALSLACSAKLPDAAVLANVAAGIVVGKLGTATVEIREIERALRRIPA